MFVMILLLLEVATWKGIMTITVLLVVYKHCSRAPAHIMSNLPFFFHSFQELKLAKQYKGPFDEVFTMVIIARNKRR